MCQTVPWIATYRLSELKVSSGLKAVSLSAMDFGTVWDAISDGLAVPKGPTHSRLPWRTAMSLPSGLSAMVEILSLPGTGRRVRAFRLVSRSQRSTAVPWAMTR
jgi:hypothetical protein